MFAIVRTLCPSVVYSASVSAVAVSVSAVAVSVSAAAVSVSADAVVVTGVTVIYDADEDKPVQVLLWCKQTRARAFSETTIKSLETCTNLKQNDCFG